jgi:hypothetical protein
MSEIDSAPSSASARFAGADALIALCGFGGVLAWSRWMPVEQRRRMTARELDGALSWWRRCRTNSQQSCLC